MTTSRTSSTPSFRSSRLVSCYRFVATRRSFNLNLSTFSENFQLVKCQLESKLSLLIYYLNNCPVSRSVFKLRFRLPVGILEMSLIALCKIRACANGSNTLKSRLPHQLRFHAYVGLLYLSWSGSNKPAAIAAPTPVSRNVFVNLHHESF